MFARAAQGLTDIAYNLAEKVQPFAQSYASGLRKADAAQRQLIRTTGYGQSILDPRYRQAVRGQGVSFKKDPVEFLGAYSSRLLVDVANDGTRTYFWRYNHPVAASQAVSDAYMGNYTRSPTGQALVKASIALPAIAAAGTYDITNPDEQFRPRGYAQRYAEVGAEDRRTTTQPGAEMFERFFLGRTGDPLKYATAKQEIPDLTPERYANYQRFLYQDKGLLGLGVIKGTMENLEGKPEVRMLGFPMGLPMVAGFAGGSVAAKASLKRDAQIPRTGTPAQRLVRGAVAGLAGSVGGVLLGNVANEVIARANRPTYPSTTQYDQNIS
jgi:hypothetical protein